MESIGDKLRTTREEKSLSIDQVARDTNIAKRYIVALEDEAFAEFPGEPYLVGFLRNYSDYLGLDSEEIVGLYKNFKIQEQPVPMEELLETKKRRTGGPRVYYIVSAAVVVALIVYALVSILSSPKSGSASGASMRPAGREYVLKDEIVETRFESGDTVVVPVGGKSVRVKLTVVNDSLVLTYPGGQQTLKLGEEKPVDLTGDNVPDVKVFVRDIDLRDPNKAVVVRFDRFIQSPQGASDAQPPSAPGAAPAGAADQSAPSAAAASPQIPTIDPAADVTTANNGPSVIMEEPSAGPFTLSIDFSGYCLLRYTIDGQAGQERYYRGGETARIDANQSVQIWASNAGSISAHVAGKDIALGNPGEVVADEVKWVRSDSDGQYQLELVGLD